MAEVLIKRLRNGDALHREAADALVTFGAFSEFVLSDTERGLAFVRWQREKPPDSEHEIG